MSNLRLSRPVARNAGKETVNAKRWGSCIVLSGRFRECLVAGSLQQRPASLRHTCTRASKDGLEEVEFEWRGEAGKVLLTGSFLDWDKNVALESAGDGVFKVKQSLPPGSHQYKFLVDGKWQHREDLETVPDGIGGVNNQVVVAEPKTPSKSEAKGKDTERSAPKAKETAQKPLEEKGTAREEEASPQREPTQPATPTPDELQAIAVKAPPPGEKPEPIEKTVAKVTGKDDEKKAPEKKSSDEPKAAKPAAKKADSQPKDSDSPAPKPKAAPRPKAKAAAASEEGENGAPTADAAPTPKAKPAPKAKAAGKAAGKKAGKAPAKPLNELMQEDVVPLLAAELEKENVTDVELVWENNELRGCFVNGGVPYCFWAFFPDGKLEGSRGFSITSHGYPPSTIEPFFVDERPQGMTPQMMVFWIRKRLFAQKSALPRLN